MNNELKGIFFTLLRDPLDGEALNAQQKALLTPEALQSLYVLSQKHDLAHLLGYALEKNGVDGGQAFAKAQMLAVFRHEQMQYDYGEICRVLSEGGVDFMPLKGALIRPCYPEAWMRTSCDVDVLIRPEDTERAVAHLTAEGWQTDGERNYHDVSLHSPTGTHLELHFTIRENLPAIDEMLDEVWEHSSPVREGAREYRQSDAFLIFHLLAHMSYHFINGGCGVRSVLDLWMVRGRLHPDGEELGRLCERAGLSRFRERLDALVEAWFGGAQGEPMDECLAAMEDFLLAGGVFGSVKNRVKLDQAKAGGKGKNLLSRIFMPAHKLKAKYPKLERHPWLLPWYQLLRWTEMLKKGRLGASLNEMKLNSGASQEEIQSAQLVLRELGLMKGKKQ